MGKPQNLFKEDTIPVESGTFIKKKGFFDLDKLNKTVIKFFKDYKYSGKWQSNIHVKEFMHGRENDMDFKSRKEVDQYHKYYIEVRFVIYRLKKVIIEKKGKKIQMHHGEIEIIFNPYFKKNYGVDTSKPVYEYEHSKEGDEYKAKKSLGGSKLHEKRMFGSSVFDKFIKYIYDRYIIKDQTFSHFGKLRLEVLELRNRLKKELNCLHI